MSEDPLKIGRFNFGRQLTGSLLVVGGTMLVAEDGNEASDTGGVGTNSVACMSSGRVVS